MQGASKADVRFFAIGGAFCLAVGASIGLWVWAPVAVLGALLVLFVLVRNANLMAPLLAVAAVPFARPNILGERFSWVAGGLLLLAALLAVVADRGRLRYADRASRPLRSVGFWVAIAYLWLIVRASTLAPTTEFQPLMQSVVLVVLAVIAAGVVMAEERRRRILAKLWTWMVVACCASFAVTAALWYFKGIGVGQIGTINVGGLLIDQPVYFPFTTTASTQTVFGFTFPRFDGIGREPGWMAMYCAFTYFLLPYTGIRRRWVRPLLIAGLLGTFSTAGFGVGVMVWTFEKFLRRRDKQTLLGAYLRVLFGLGVVAAGAWVAITAPVFGLAAKATLNATSLGERQAATLAGWQALWNSPLGGGAADKQAAVNLVAAIAAVGLPFSLAIVAALWSPRRSHRARSLTTAPVAVLFLTLLLSQPAIDSTWVFVLATLAYAVTQPAAAELAPPERDDASPQAQGAMKLASASAHMR